MTDRERLQLLDTLRDMVTRDFGLPPEHPYETFCPHCIGHRAVADLYEVYEDLEAIRTEEVADQMTGTPLERVLNKVEQELEQRHQMQPDITSEEADDIAERILKERELDDPDIENVVPA